jgi:hypothetical protein
MIISFKSIACLVDVLGTQHVFYEVGTKFLYDFLINFSSKLPMRASHAALRFQFTKIMHVFCKGNHIILQICAIRK